MTGVPLVGADRSAPTIVRNEDRGIWDRDGRSFRLVRELVVGADDSDAHQVFGSVRDIAVNSRGQLLILEGATITIRVFDANGTHVRTFGKAGEGPGDLAAPSALTVDTTDSVLVADRWKVAIYDGAGTFAREFRHHLSDAYVRSIRVSGDGSIFLSSHDVFEQVVLHKYSRSGTREVSFCDSYAAGRDIDVMAEAHFGGGTMDISGDRLYYSQLTPYEIRVFGTNGVPLTVISREIDLPGPGKAYYSREDGALQFRSFPGSFAILAIADGRFLNVVKRPEEKSAVRTIVDLYGADGRLLATRSFPENFLPKCSDHRERVYAIEANAGYVVSRYRVVFD